MSGVSTPARDKVLAELRALLLTVRPALHAEVPEGASFTVDLGLDSLDVVEFVARVERYYRAQVPDETWTQLTTLGRVADYVLACRQ
jgi:acyl carrier protein